MNSLFPFEWILATRFMREGLLQTLFIIVGVALGVAVIVFMSSLIIGLQGSIIKRTLDYQAQIIILPPEEVARSLRDTEANANNAAILIQPRAQRLRSVDQWQKVRELVLHMNGVDVVSPIVSGAGFVLRADANRAVAITGIEPETYLQLIALKAKIIAGKPELTTTDIVIGTELAKDLGVWLNDKINLQTASGASVTLIVCGIFDYGNKGQNERAVYVALRTAQSLLNLPSGATSVEINLNDPYQAQIVAEQIQAQTGLKVDSWITTNTELFTALYGQKITFFVIRLFVGLTAALGIASVLVVSVVQKSKEIGILRATGSTRVQILRIFLLQGALFGLIGSVFGSAASWGLLVAWRNLAKNPDGTPFFVLSFDPMYFVYAGLGAMLVGIISAVFPAQRAARLDPAVAIRG
jgi:lipoprotein-releasing system permease protein